MDEAVERVPVEPVPREREAVGALEPKLDPHLGQLVQVLVEPPRDVADVDGRDGAEQAPRLGDQTLDQPKIALAFEGARFGHP
jgi:hypothetical protein